MQITQTTASFFKSKVNINLFYLVLQKYIIWSIMLVCFVFPEMAQPFNKCLGGGGVNSTNLTSLRSFPGTQMSSDLLNWIGPILNLSLHSFPGIFIKQHGLWFCEAVNLAALQEISRETWKMPDCKFSIYFYWMLGPHQTVVSFKITLQRLMQTFNQSKKSSVLFNRDKR